MIQAEKYLLINCSRNETSRNYNLAIEKMKVYFGPERCIEGKSVNDLFYQDCDGVMLSCIFSWDVPFAVEQAKLALSLGKKVMIGGGGTYQLRNWIKDETGLDAHYNANEKLDSVRGQFKMVYFTRGCIEKCFFCIVPKIEGNIITLNKLSQPAPLLLDNNLSEIPRAYQEYIVERYLESGIRYVDCNSGFEPKGITPETVQLFDQLPMKYWRVGFDEISEESQFLESIKTIRAYSKKRIRVYTMFGHEPFEQCRYRCEKVLELKCEPYPQAYIQLNAKERIPFIKHDWDHQKLIDFGRFYRSPQFWRGMKLKDYVPRVDGRRPFAAVL